MELGPTTGEMRLCKLEHTSVEMNLRLRSNPEQQNIQVSLVQGSGFISAIYTDLRPKLTSAIRFRSVSLVSSSDTVHKWRIQLEDGNIWLLYAFKLLTYDAPLKLTLRDNSTLEGSSRFNGLIQVTKASCDEGQFSAIADACAGTWATSLQVSASHDTESPSKMCYIFDFKLHPRARSSNLLMYALPHHVESFGGEMHPYIRPNFALQSTTKGVMIAVVSTRWVLQENSSAHNIFCDLATPSDASILSPIENSAREELQGDPSGESNLDSMYFAGKALDKYASLCWVICTIIKDAQMSQDLLNKVKAAFSRFAENKQRFPLAYESKMRTSSLFKYSYHPCRGVGRACQHCYVRDGGSNARFWEWLLQ
jgi:endo-1,3(4)-beta-glucanase